MAVFYNPVWVTSTLLKYKSLDSIPKGIIKMQILDFKKINLKTWKNLLSHFPFGHPLVCAALTTNKFCCLLPHLKEMASCGQSIGRGKQRPMLNSRSAAYFKTLSLFSYLWNKNIYFMKLLWG